MENLQSRKRKRDITIDHKPVN